MKKSWKGRTGAKIGAWIGITLSGCLFLGSVVGIMGLETIRVYDYSEEELVRQAFEAVTDHYAVQALDHMEDSEDDKWSDIYFRYGIIKAENIDDIDFNDDSVYLKRNFNDRVEPEDLYVQSYEVGPNTVIDDSGTLFGGYSLYDRAPSYVMELLVSQICYNRENGIFYYETTEGLYPVQTVELMYPYDGEWYAFRYDFDRKMYQKTYGETVAEIGAAEENTSEVAASEQRAKTADAAELSEQRSYGTAQEVFAEAYITFDMLDGTDYNYQNWDTLILDYVDRAMADEDAAGEADTSTTEIRVVDNEYMAGKEIAPDTDFWMDGSKLQVNRMDEERETYWVVSMIPESVGRGWNQDFYVQANTIITLAYSLRYSIYLILLASFALGVFFFVFLIQAAGHRRDTEEITATWLDRMPFDVYLGFAGLTEIFLMAIASSMSYYIDKVAGMVLFVALIIAMCWVLLLSVLTLAVRIKCGKWWRNTVIWWILHGIFTVCGTLVQNIGLLYKAILLIGGVSLAELFLILVFGYSRQWLVRFWFLEKIIIVPLFLFAVLQMQKLKEGGEKLAEGDLHHQIDTERMFWGFKQHGENLNSISEGMSRAVDERMKSEHFKTELITNVSHDIKTPLTSIINYVDLLEKEELANDNAEEYLEVLERQSARLKKLIEDLMEASKASTGNLAVNLEKLEAGVSMVQTVGEFEEKLRENELELLIQRPEAPIYILADGRHYWRVIDNLMNNICKYAQPATRVYINLETQGDMATLTFRNTSKYPLNISSEELMERFVRGDSSRNTEGSGLGISIAKSLMELMGGTFSLYVDGDLFKVVLGFPIEHEE